MNICKIKEVCQVNPPKKIPLSQDTDISFVPMSAVSTDGKVDLSEVITVEKVKSLSVFKDGDVIFAKITPCMENGKGAVVSNLKNGYGAGSTEFTVLRPNETHISEKWLYYYLSQKHFRWTCQQNMTGSAGQKRVPAKYLAECLIPVPPLEEQQRIVARIEELFSELDAAVATLERTKEQLAVYRQAVLKEAFEGEWTYQLVTDVISSDKHSMVIGPFGSDLKVSDYCESGVPLVFVKDIRDNFSDKPREYVSVEKAEKLSAHKVSYGDLLITKMGNPPGDCVIYPNNVDAIITADCIKVTVNPEIVNAKYLMYYILSSFGKRQVDEMTCGVAQKKMSLKRFKSFTLPKISLLEQDEIVSEIESHLSVCDKIEETVNTALQEAEAMRQSILKQAFAGEL